MFFAPGGEASDEACSGPPAEQCAVNPNGCLVGLVQQEGDDNAGFGYWVGSSFAAPQVSGLVALLLDEATEAGASNSGPVSSEKIVETIACGAGEERVNVIDIEETLGSDCLALLAGTPDRLHFAQAGLMVEEDAGMVMVTVRREGEADGEVKINYRTADGSAVGDSDYAPTSGTLTFAPGETEKSFTIDLVDDTDEEENETLIISLENVVGTAEIDEPSTLTVTIRDNDENIPMPRTRKLFMPLLRR